MKRTPESLWRSAGMKYLKLKLGDRIRWHYRTVGQAAGRSGVPDDLFLVDGIFMAVEWKRPGYKASGRVTAQDQEIKSIIEAGGISGKVTCIEQLDWLVTALNVLRNGRKHKTGLMIPAECYFDSVAK